MTTVDFKKHLSYDCEYEDLILSTMCRERGVDVMRHVYVVWPCAALEEYLWCVLRDVPNMFSLGPLIRRESLQQLYEAQRMYLMIDNVGMVGIDFAQPNNEVGVHMTFWDRRLRGREKLGQFIALWIVRSFDNVSGLVTQIPAEARATLAYTKRLGFKVRNWYSASYLNSKGELDDMVELKFDALYTVHKGD